MSVSMRAVFVFVSEHLCVSKDTLKADACFEHVGESLSGPWFVCLLCVCMYECKRERERETESGLGRLMTLAASIMAAAPDRLRVLNWAALSILPHCGNLPAALPPQHPPLPGHTRLMHSTSPQGPGGQTHMCVCMCVCLMVEPLYPYSITHI